MSFLDYCFAFTVIIAVSNAFIASSTALTPEEDINLSNDKARVIGVGSAIQSGELKYRLGLRPFIRSSESCGASLVEVENVQVAITSALCPHLHKLASFAAYYSSNDSTKSPSDYFKLAGSNFRRGGKGEHQQQRKIVDYVLHEKFNVEKYPLNDIAVIFIDKPFDKTDHVGTIALPKQNQPIGGRVVLPVWSDLKSESVQSNLALEPFESLLKVEVPVLDYAACTDSINSTSLDEFNESLFCAGFKNKLNSLYSDDNCPIDSGGPIKSVEGNFLAGVISSGNLCKSPDSPAANVNVASYADWITEEVRKYKAGGSDEDSKEDSDSRLWGLLRN